MSVSIWCVAGFSLTVASRVLMTINRTDSRQAKETQVATNYILISEQLTLVSQGKHYPNNLLLLVILIQCPNACLAHSARADNTVTTVTESIHHLSCRQGTHVHLTAWRGK